MDLELKVNIDKTRKFRLLPVRAWIKLNYKDYLKRHTRNDMANSGRSYYNFSCYICDKNNSEAFRKIIFFFQFEI